MDFALHARLEGITNCRIAEEASTIRRIAPRNRSAAAGSGVPFGNDVRLVSSDHAPEAKRFGGGEMRSCVNMARQRPVARSQNGQAVTASIVGGFFGTFVLTP